MHALTITGRRCAVVPVGQARTSRLWPAVPIHGGDMTTMTTRSRPAHTATVRRRAKAPRPAGS